MALVPILLADENKSWREFVSSVLRQDPSLEIICEVSDGLKAVKMAEKLQPSVVVLNINLPNLSGLEASGWISMLAPNTKIVFLADRLEADLVEAAMKLGSGGYLLKSEAARNLVAAIRAVGRGETFFSCQLAARLMAGLKSSLQRRMNKPGLGPPAPGVFSRPSATL